jgi:hypothetical protein
MSSREIFKLISKTIGFLLFCYGLVVGLSGGVLLYAVGPVVSDLFVSTDAGGWLGIPTDEGYLILLFLITQGILPVTLGLLFMGTDIVPDFCFPKRPDKRLSSTVADPRKFEISEGPSKWKPPKF